MTPKTITERESRHLSFRSFFLLNSIAVSLKATVQLKILSTVIALLEIGSKMLQKKKNVFFHFVPTELCIVSRAIRKTQQP